MTSAFTFPRLDRRLWSFLALLAFCLALTRTSEVAPARLTRLAHGQATIDGAALFGRVDRRLNRHMSRAGCMPVHDCPALVR